MSKILNRLLVFFIGVPLIVSFTFISVCDFLPLQLLVLFFSALTSIEFSNLLGKKMAVQNPYLVLVLAYLIIFSVISMSFASVPLCDE